MEHRFLSVFNDLLAERGLNRKQFADQSGIPYPTVIGWTNLKRLPDYDALLHTADFFSCSLDYLTGREGFGEDNTISERSADEFRLIAAYRDCDEKDRKLILSISNRLRKQ